MTRWRSIFYKALEVCPTFAAEVVACCAILHNICLDNGDIVEEVIMSLLTMTTAYLAVLT